MIHFGFIGVTVVESVTNSAATVYTADVPDVRKFRLLISSDVDIHIQRDPAGTVSPTVDPSSAPRIPANTIVEVSIFGEEQISAVIAASASGNGSIWITLAE